MARTPPALLPGTLDLLILKTLSVGSNHGYGIARRIHEASEEVLTVEEGSLYPALHRLEKRGLIRAEWRRSDANRRAKYYSLTADGRRDLRRETASWRELSAAIGRVLAAPRWVPSTAAGR